MKKKYVWVPAILTLYAAAMAFFNRDSLNSPVAARNYWITLGVETVLIILVAVFLKRADTLKRRREEIEKKLRP